MMSLDPSDIDAASDRPIVRDLRALARRNGLHGATLICFAEDGSGFVSVAEEEPFARALRRLGEEIVELIGDGRFDGAFGETQD